MDRKPVRVARIAATLVVPFLLAVPLADSASAQFSPGQQFAPVSSPPYPYDRVEGECVNLETELIAPILCIPDPGPSVPGGDLVAVANDADERVVFLDMNLALVGETFVGQGPAALALNPAAPELWVSVRNQSSVVVIDLLSLTVKQVLRPTINVNGVGAGRASTPGGIAFANGKAYVASTFTDELLIWDAVTTGHPLVKSLSLVGRFHDAAAVLNDPYAVVSDGLQVFVTSHLSGNNTAPLCHENGGHVNFDVKNKSFLGPDNNFIEALGPGSSSGLDLPDFDVAVVDATTDKVTRFVRGVGTVLFDVAAAPAGSGTFLVTNLEAQNTIVGEDAFPQGKVSLNRLTQFNATGVVSTTVLEGLGGGGTTSIVMPTALEVLPDGRRLVAGYCSSNVGVLSGAGAFLGAIPVPAGPRGIDYWSTANRIFVLSRATSMVTSFDAGGAATVPTSPLATFTLSDPTFDRVKQGRLEFLLPNSGAQTANCATCHVDGRNDGIGWNLSKRLSTNPNPVVADDFRDRKGVMITQDLRGLPGAPPYHWRGEQKDVEDFNGAFEHLLHGTPLPADRLAKLKDYFFSLEYPPNPFETMNRVYSPLATSGFNVYTNNGTVGVCSKCHALPLGTDGDITEPLLGDTSDGTTPAGDLATDVAALRGLWTRASAVADADPAPGPSAVESIRMTGFGLLHEGMVDTFQEFLVRFFSALVQAGTDDDVTAFVNELDSGLAPATLFSVLVDGGATMNANMDLVEFFLLDQARAGTPTLRGNCDVAARGIIDLGSGRIPVGMVYRALPDKFDLSSSAVQATWEGQLGHPIRAADVRGLAAQGKALLLFTGVPSGSGERAGIDRDRDGVVDDDETTTDPKNPDSNGDGLWDGFAPGAPQVVNGSVQVVYATTDAIKISYETDRLSPTIVDFTEAGGTTTYRGGDEFQPVGPGTSNQWRRRHTAFIRPQPAQGLTMLRPITVYNFTILTQGQDDLRATFPGFTGTSLKPFITDAFRCSQIRVIQRINNGNGTFTFDIRALFEATAGNPSIDGNDVPARFIFTDANDQLSFVNMKATITGGVAIFQWTTAGGASPQQASGKPVFLDLPMWLIPAGATAPLSFPGQWPDSVTSKETTAP